MFKVGWAKKYSSGPATYIYNWTVNAGFPARVISYADIFPETEVQTRWEILTAEISMLPIVYAPSSKFNAHFLLEMLSPFGKEPNFLRHRLLFGF